MSIDRNLLVSAGLNDSQAAVYSLLFEKGEARPADVAAELKMSRTNSYKVFEQLEELRLAHKKEINKKLVYFPTNPTNLSNLTAQYRAEATAKENAVKQLMQDLLNEYRKHSDKPHVQVYSGKNAVESAYRKQNNLKEDVSFIHTHADVPIMGFETMHGIRTTPARYGNRRQAIMRSSGGGNSKVNWDSHQRTNLEITWSTKDNYDAPVEWRVTKSSFLIVLYDSSPYAIFIVDPVVAGAFLQLFKTLQVFLKDSPAHKKKSLEIK